MPDASILKRRSVHGMFAFIVFSVGMTSLILFMYVKVTAEIDELQDSPFLVTRYKLAH